MMRTAAVRGRRWRRRERAGICIGMVCLFAGLKAARGEG